MCISARESKRNNIPREINTYDGNGKEMKSQITYSVRNSRYKQICYEVQVKNTIPLISQLSNNN